MTANATTTTSASTRIRAAVVWALLYTLLWAVLGQGRGWSFGAPMIAAAVLLGDYLKLYPLHLSVLRIPFFIGFFLVRLLRGGIDVSIRTLRRQPAAHADWVVYRFSPQASAAVRLLMSTVVGMLPGTLAARIECDVMHMHILDTTLNWHDEAQALEQQLLRLVGRRGEVPR